MHNKPVCVHAHIDTLEALIGLHCAGPSLPLINFQSPLSIRVHTNHFNNHLTNSYLKHKRWQPVIRKYISLIYGFGPINLINLVAHKLKYYYKHKLPWQRFMAQMNCQTSLYEFIIYRIFKMQLAIIRIMTEYNLLCEKCNQSEIENQTNSECFSKKVMGEQSFTIQETIVEWLHIIIGFPLRKAIM